MRVIGGIEGAKAKDSRFVKNYGGHGKAYFVPQSELDDCATSPVDL